MLAALFGAPSASEAAFLQPEGTTQLITTAGMSGILRDFDSKGPAKPNRTVQKTSFDVLLSHGLTDTLTFVATSSKGQLTSMFSREADSSISWTAMAGLRMPLWQSGGSIVSVQALAGAGRDTGRSGLTAEARLMAGHSLTFGSLPGFADVQVAWLQTAPGARPEMRLDATLGFNPHKKLTVLGQVFSAYGFNHDGRKSSLRIKAQLGLVWQFSEAWSVQASGHRTIFGRNAAQQTGAALGLWRRF